jgi:hypothetical protein
VFDWPTEYRQIGGQGNYAEGLNEFAADDGDSGEEDILHKYARMWWNGDDATQQKIEAALARMGWEIGEDEGGYDNGGVFVVRAGDENGKSYTSWPAEDLAMDEGVWDTVKQIPKKANAWLDSPIKGMNSKHAGHAVQGAVSGMTHGHAVGHAMADTGVHEGSDDPFGPQGRFVGDTGPAQITATVRQVPLRTGDRVIYKPTEQRATIEALSRDGTKARIHVPSPMGGRTFNCEVADLKAIGRGSLEEKSTSQAQFRTMAAAAHDPKFARKVGIKPSVAKEFHKADKGQSYKSLPKKATEGASVTTTPGSIEPGGAIDNFKQQMANNTEKQAGVAEAIPLKTLRTQGRDEKEADYGDDYQDMVKRVKRLAGLGPLKTVYDPAKRVYRNMPTAVQPKK